MGRGWRDSYPCLPAASALGGEGLGISPAGRSKCAGLGRAGSCPSLGPFLSWLLLTPHKGARMAYASALRGSNASPFFPDSNRPPDIATLHSAPPGYWEPRDGDRAAEGLHSMGSSTKCPGFRANSPERPAPNVPQPGACLGPGLEGALPRRRGQSRAKGTPSVWPCSASLFGCPVSGLVLGSPEGTPGEGAGAGSTVVMWGSHLTGLEPWQAKLGEGSLAICSRPPHWPHTGRWPPAGEP